MFTQQANNLAALFSQVGDGKLSQGLLQAFANCSQALQTRGSVNINGAAGSRPPRGGMITNWPNEGSGVPNQYPGNSWNSQDPTGDNYYYGGNDYWGGDTYYGDTFLQNQFTTNLGDWYQQTFTDNSYNDLRTTLQTTTNKYDQSVNNFAGDNYFDNTTTYDNTTNNNVTNLGDVVNQGPVTNQNTVTNEGDTYLSENTFINNEGNNVNIAQFIANIVVNILVGGPQRPVVNIPPVLNLRGRGRVQVPDAWELDDNCNIKATNFKTVNVDVAIAPVRRDIGR